MTVLGMTFWEWAGTAVITGLSGGVALKLLGWLKEYLDRKARKISYHAKALLEQADLICGVARAMAVTVKEIPGQQHFQKQASVLWVTSSTSSLLNVWLANAWVLERRRNLRSVRGRFVESVEELRTVSVAWREAERKWRKAIGLSEFRTQIIKNPKHDDLPETQAKRDAATKVHEQVETFLVEFQGLHKALQPYVREYTSARDAEEPAK